MNLSDMGLGDASMVIVAKIIETIYFSRVDLSKNLFKDDGLKLLSVALVNNTSIVSLSLSGN